MSDSEEEIKRANEFHKKENISNSLKLKHDNIDKNVMMYYKEDDVNIDMEKSMDSARTENNASRSEFNNDQINNSNRGLNFTVFSAQNKDKISTKQYSNNNNKIYDHQQMFPNSNLRTSSNLHGPSYQPKPLSSKEFNQNQETGNIENKFNSQVNQFKPPNTIQNLQNNFKNNQLKNNNPQVINSNLIPNSSTNFTNLNSNSTKNFNININQKHEFFQPPFKTDHDQNPKLFQQPYNPILQNPNSIPVIRPNNFIPKQPFQQNIHSQYENETIEISNSNKYQVNNGINQIIYSQNNDENIPLNQANTMENTANILNPRYNVVEDEEIKCEDHFNKLNGYNIANRYCLVCKIFCCDSCVIDFHAVHILQAKNKLEDIFKQTRNEIDELKNKTNSNIKNQNASSEDLSKFLVYQIKSINNNYKQTEASLNQVKKRIDDILQLEKDLLRKLSISLEEYIKEECLSPIEELINTTRELSERQEELSKDFDAFRKFEKGDLVKQNVISILKQEYTEKASNFNQILTNNKDKISIIEKNIFSIFSNNSYIQNLNKVISSLNEIYDKQANFFNQFHKESFGNKNLSLENNSLNNQMFENDAEVCVRKPNISKNVEDYGMKFEDEENIKQELDLPFKNFIEVNSEKLTFLACVRPKSDEIYIYDSSSEKVRIIKNKKSNFGEKDISFDNFPDNCKYINLGQSVLFTGGTFDNNITISNCYLLFTEKKGEELEISIMPYSNMIHERQRHNIIHLKDRNYIVVCSGFFNDYAEFSDLSSQQWYGLPKMNRVRANATMAYISNKYVYCIGGYQLKEKNKPGVYLNSCEYLDLDKQDNGWRTIEFEILGGTIKNCAMGVIPISLNSILLCGGYDGATYKNEIFKLILDEDEVIIERKEESLPESVIFLHSQFARLNKYAFNFDSNMNLIKYNPMKSLFEV